MPRKSAAELATVSQVVSVVPRPVAPSELTDEQAAEWEAVVSRLPADWFPRETHGLLAQYCRHVVEARRIAQLIERQEGYDIKEYDMLLKMQEREGRALSSLATRMRITQQSQWSEQKGKGGDKPDRKPWE